MFVIVASIFLLRKWAHSRQEALAWALFGYGLFWTISTLSPVLNLAGVGENVFAERYLYLPSVGFVWIAGLIWHFSIRRQALVAWSAGVVIVIICSAQVVARNHDWHDELTLMQVTARQSPESMSTHNALAMEYSQRGNNERAMAEYRAALELQPNNPGLHHNLGTVLMKSGKPREAIAEYQIALKLKPDFAGAHYNLGVAFEAVGDAETARGEYETAVAQDPKHAIAMLNLSSLYYKTGRVEEAIDLNRRVAALAPDEGAPYNNLAALYNSRGRHQEAMESARKAIRVGGAAGDAYLAHYNLGIAYNHLASTQLAASEFRTSLQLRPDYRPAREALEKLEAQRE